MCVRATAAAARAKGGHIGSARRRAHRCKQARGQQRGGRSGQRARGEPRQHASKTTRRRAAHGGERGAQWEQRGSITHACRAHKLASQRSRERQAARKQKTRSWERFQWHRAGAHLLYIWKFYYILVDKSYAAAAVRDRRSRKVRSVTSIKVRRAVAVFPTTSNQVHPPTLWSTALSSDFDRHRRAVPCRNAPHHARCTRRRVSLDRHWHERDSVRVVAMRERRRAPATVPLSLE